MSNGVRVTGIQHQCSERMLWSYFPKATDIYYPLLNNDAVVIFRDTEATAAELTRTHDKWEVQPLPNQVFTKQLAYVDADLSAILLATDTYLESLKHLGNVEVSTDKSTKQLIIKGQPYQVEWAWQYLSKIQENQLLLLKKSQSRSIHSNLSNGNTHTNDESISSREKAYSHRPSSRSPHPQDPTLLDLSPREASVKSQVSSSSKRSGAASPTEASIRGGRGSGDRPSRADDQSRLSPREELDRENSTAAYSRRQAGLSEDPSSLGGLMVRERRRQDDANNTFHHFASLPAQGQNANAYSADYNIRNRVSPSSTYSSPDVNPAEAARRSEKQHVSFRSSHLKYYDDHDEHGATGGFHSLQPDYYDQKEDRLAYGKGRGPASLQTSHSTQYNLYKAPLELSRESFDICKQINLYLRLKIYMDDITKVRTSAVVNAANWELKNIGGVAGALARAAGPEMADECERFVEKNGTLDTAQVVMTKAYGHLHHLKCVLHTVGPIYKEKEKDICLYELTQAFYNCLQFAHEHLLQSITFPFISTGIFGMPIEDCVLALITALLVFGYDRLKDEKFKTATCFLGDVHFIHNDINVVCEAIMTAKELFKKETVETAVDRMDTGKKHYSHYVYPMCRSTQRKKDKKNSQTTSQSASGHLDPEKNPDRYGTWDTSKKKADEDSSLPRRYQKHDDEAASYRSLPVVASSTSSRTRSNSLDRGRKTSSMVDSKSSQKAVGGAREPSPRPRALSSSGTPGTSSSKSASPESAKGATAKSQPTIKPALTTTASNARMKPKSRKTASSSQSMRLSGRASDQSVDTDSASAAGSEADEHDAECPICLEPMTNSKKLPCRHRFCTVCIERAMTHNPRCPRCQKAFGMAKGTQPQDGTMSYTVSRLSSLPGYEECGTIIINYYFPSGAQEACHPQPGSYYGGIQRTAYLPDNAEGNKVLKLMRKAFNNRLMFTIGDSVTTGATGVITWNDIHHKTSISGGPSNYGYPDPGYLTRVKEELAAKGITSP